MTKAALLRALGAGQVSAQTGSVDDSAKAEGGAFAVEPLHTRVLFGVSHFGFTTYYGEFSGVSGAVDRDAKNPSASKLDIRIPAASISTTNAELNGELKGEEWFDTAKYPNITARTASEMGTASTGTSANRSPFKRAEFGSPIRMAVSALFIAAGIATASPVFAGTERGSQNMADTSDAALAASLPGDFRNGYAEVNGTRIHYVEGGKGTPVLLLPGWPQTWWEFHKIMPELAKRHRVIAVDLRGMGGSAKPGLGYDKKNMAKDIHELTQALGYKQVNIAGHDIGAMVAYSFAANYPDATLKICLIDVAHPEESLYTLSLLPPPGHAVRGTGESTHPVYLWWFAFNQLPDLPQQLLAGKSRLLIDWLFDSQLRNPAAISERDRAIYAAAYSQPDAIRAGNGWYQTFGQDIIDAKHYGQIATPVLALAGERNYPYLRELLPTQASDVRVVKVNSSSHYVPEDQPEAVVRELLGFFKS